MTGQVIQPPLRQSGRLADRVRAVFDEQRPVAREGVGKLRDVCGGSQVVHLALGARVVDRLAGLTRGSIELGRNGPSTRQEKSEQQKEYEFAHRTVPIYGAPAFAAATGTLPPQRDETKSRCRADFQLALSIVHWAKDGIDPLAQFL